MRERTLKMKFSSFESTPVGEQYPLFHPLQYHKKALTILHKFLCLKKINKNQKIEKAAEI